MKKPLLIALFAIASLTVTAQNYDTLQGPGGRIPRYHYSCWYDTHPAYFDTNTDWTGLPPIRTSARVRGWTTHPDIFDPMPRIHLLAKLERMDQETLLAGVAVLTMDSSDWGSDPRMHICSSTDSVVVPDTCFVLSLDHETRKTEILGLARWDTVTPKILKLPFNVDTNRFGFRYFKAYEAYFPQPVAVDTVYYTASTINNQEVNSHNLVCFLHMPRCFGEFTMTSNYSQPYYCYDAPSPDLEDEGTLWAHLDEVDSFEYRRTITYGMFLPILYNGPVDTVLLRASSADPTMGTASPTRQRIPRWHRGTVSATPLRGYQFDHWVNDGSRDNPHHIQMNADSVHYIATFRPGVYWVEATNDNKDEGWVVGGGRYNSFDTATLEVIANTGFRFSHWNDGNTDNPRRIEVVSDTAFTAYFEVDTTHGSGDTTAINPVEDALPSLFTLTPNPTTGEVQVIVKSEKLKDKSCTVTVLDAAGHEVLRTTLNSQPSTLNLQSLPAGAYFVTLSDGTVSATQKLILK